jgi:hypothetical protein
MNFEYDEVYQALEESIKLQAHYARILNMYDGGKRIEFRNASDWLHRIRKLDSQKEKNGKEHS